MHTILVIGSAGAGKSTFAIHLYDQLSNNNPILVNLDPSTTSLNDYSFDVREFIKTTDVMEECDLGPNGAILVAFSSMVNEMSNMLDEMADTVVIVDMPGQIEIYLHCESFIELVNLFKPHGPIVIVSIFDMFNFTSPEKFLSASMNSIIVRTRVTAPLITLVSKCDLFGLGGENEENPEDITHDQNENSDSNEKQSGEEAKDEISIQNKPSNKKSAYLNDKVLNFIDDEDNLFFPPEDLETPLQSKIYDFLILNDACTFKMIDYSDTSNVIYEIKTVLQYFDDCETKQVE